MFQSSCLYIFPSIYKARTHTRKIENFGKVRRGWEGFEGFLPWWSNCIFFPSMELGKILHSSLIIGFTILLLFFFLVLIFMIATSFSYLLYLFFKNIRSAIGKKDSSNNQDRPNEGQTTSVWLGQIYYNNQCLLIKSFQIKGVNVNQMNTRRNHVDGTLNIQIKGFL